MNTVLQQLLTGAYKLFTAPLFQIGQTSISISSIFQIILLLVIIVFLTRTLKTLLKRRLLARLKIDEGNREAIATIVTYSTCTLGVLIFLQSSSFNLASLAVLAGGLGIGIGFGLQNIAKDFVSGLILLMERHVKVEDFVEFGIRQAFTGLKGTVKEISLRATIIRTNDGADLIVPNSDLIQYPILNWNHKSSQGRIHIFLRVSYDSNPVLVTEIILNSAYMEPAVLREPPPKVIFREFGENYLFFELQVWIERMEREDPIKSSLSFIIDYNLRQQGIKMPYSQRELWFRNPEFLSTLVPEKDDSQNVTQFAQQQFSGQPSKPLSLRDLLRQVTYFQNFTDLEVRQLIEIGYRKRLSESEVLFQENDSGDAFYIILHGSVEVFVEKISKHLSTLQAGDFFGELSLMLGIPRTATVRALKETILFVIEKKRFEKLLQDHPELAEEIVQELGKHQEELAERQQQLRELGLVDAAEYDKNLVVWVRKRLKKIFSLPA